MSIRNEAFNQPLFGRNNLSFNVVPHTNWGSGVAFSVKLEFCNGGAQTFLRAFWRLMSGVNDCRNAPSCFRLFLSPLVATAVPDVIRSISSGHFASSAFVDPSDPTYIYTSQPYTPTTVPLLSASHVARPSVLPRALLLLPALHTSSSCPRPLRPQQTLCRCPCPCPCSCPLRPQQTLCRCSCSCACAVRPQQTLCRCSCSCACAVRPQQTLCRCPCAVRPQQTLCRCPCSCACAVRPQQTLCRCPCPL